MADRIGRTRISTNVDARCLCFTLARQALSEALPGSTWYLIQIPLQDITNTEGSIAQRREHKERMAPGICVKAFQALQQASTICS